MSRRHRKQAPRDKSPGGRPEKPRDDEFLRSKGLPHGGGRDAARSGQAGHVAAGGHTDGARGPGGSSRFRGRQGPERSREGGGGGVDFEAVLLARYKEDVLVAMARRTDERLAKLLAPKTNESQPANTDVAPPSAPAQPLASLQPSRSYVGRARPAPARDEILATLEEKRSLPAEPKLSSLFGSKRALRKEETTPEQAQVAHVTEGGLRLDAWQAEALEALLAGANVVVDAPTSAGKTRVIEALLEHKMKEGIKLIYTSPVKSLSNDKYREFTEKYGKEKVGINTGDFKENLGAPIVLATLETYRNSLLGVEPNMSRRIVVYDEYHYLQDESRGSAWEESIILTPKESQLVLLSASVPNAEDFAHWIQSLYGTPCKVIRVSERPVPLVDIVHTKWGWILADELALTAEEIARLRKLLRSSTTRRFLKQKEELTDMLVPVARALERNMGPVVAYAGRRASVEAIAQAFAKHLRGDFRGPEADKLHERIRDLPGWDYVPPELQRLIRKHGIAYHHSGMIPPGRVAIETLLKEGLLRLCTGTMGISLGVNFAVRSAIVSDETRPSEGGDTRYSNSEILQMLGRAGRRGNDKQGFSLWVNPGRYAEQRPRAREVCTSSLKFDPTTVLGILGQHESLSYLSDFYRKSFFMRGKDANLVVVEDHDLLSGLLYRKGDTEIACTDIPATYQRWVEGKQRSKVACNVCPARPDCHSVMEGARQATLNRIVRHLTKVGALEGPRPSKLGQLARHFPQAGGLIIARWLATGEFGAHNFRDFMQAMSVFCSAHFKDIPDTYANTELLRGLQVPKLVDKFYPEDLFPELYDEPPTRGNYQGDGSRVFRECNPAAASLVSAWVEHNVSWETLVEEHSSKYFSAGDCMMVLFRFSTFLQSCVRLETFDKDLAVQAKEVQKRLLRDPLDARNRMLLDDEAETPEIKETATPEAEAQGLATAMPAAWNPESGAPDQSTADAGAPNAVAGARRKLSLFRSRTPPQN